MLDTLVVHPRSAADLVGRDPRATLGLPGKEDAAALFRRRGQVLRLDKSHRQVWTSLAAQDVRGAPRGRGSGWSERRSSDRRRIDLCECKT